MYPERLLHKALTLIGPRRGGSFCPRMCVGVGLRVRVRVGWAGVGWGGVGAVTQHLELTTMRCVFISIRCFCRQI